MRVHRSLTIKQMATVSTVAIVVICIFTFVQLFHFVKQRRIEYAQQMENIAHTIRLPLSEAVLRANIPEAERLLKSLEPAGVLGRADINLSDSFQTLHVDFSDDSQVPALIAELFDLPVTITVPLYSVDHSRMPKAIAYLVLEADSSRVYQFILNTIATMLITYLLLALILSVSISWFINQLIVHPLRDLNRNLKSLPYGKTGVRLAMPEAHRDDEIGVLVRSINHHHRKLDKLCGEFPSIQSPSSLMKQSQFIETLNHHLPDAASMSAVVVINVAFTASGAAEPQVSVEKVLPVWIARLQQQFVGQRILAQLSEQRFALLIQPFAAASNLSWLEHKIEALTAPISIEHLQIIPAINLGVAQADNEEQGEVCLTRALSALKEAQTAGKNNLQLSNR